MIAVVLAAGRSTRMGRPKAHLPWGDTTILGRVLATLHAAGIGDVVVAARAGDAAAADAARAVGADVAWVAGDDALPTASLQAALAHVAASNRVRATRAVLVLPGDMPLVLPATVVALVATFDGEPGGDERIVAPTHGGRRGHPVIFGAAHVPALAALGPAARPRDVVLAAGRRVRLVAVEDAGVVTDIDDVVAYERWRPR